MSEDATPDPTSPRPSPGGEGPYRTLIEQAADAILVSDAYGNLIDANDMACRLTGYTRDELLRLHVADTYRPEERQLAVDRLSALAHGGRVVGERFVRRKDGVDVPVSISVRRLSDGRMQGIYRDLTEWKRAEDALGRSEEKFSKMFRCAPVGMAVSGFTDGVLWEVNREFERLLGYAREESLGRTSHALGLWVDAALRDQIVARLARGEEVSDLELELRTKSGAILAVRSSFESLGLDGGTYLLSAFVDITDTRTTRESLRRSEAYFRSLIEQALDIITVLNPDGTIRYTSPANERILGYRPEEVRGRSVFDLLHPDDAAIAERMFSQALREPGAVRSMEVRFRHRDGSWRMLEAVGRNLRDDPIVGGVIINSHDVTMRRALEVQLFHAQKMEAIGRLAGGVAHDFNNIVTAISGFSDLLVADLSPGHPGLGYVDEIRRATNRASALTRQLLAFSRQQVLAPRVLDLNGLVRNLGNLLDRLLGADVQLLYDLEEPLPAVRADAGQLEQVIMNLAVNARDAMPDGGQLTIATGRASAVEACDVAPHDRAAPGPYVTLSVTDTGVGMEPETQARLFEPFFTTKEVGRGTGLGLSTVHGIVHQSGGAIRVRSGPGLGATFRIFLPAVGARPEAATPAAPANPVRGGTETLLLVEDDDSVRRIAREALHRMGYRILEAANGPIALEAAARHGAPIDLLVTDLVMPEGNGRVLASQLRAAYPGIRVLFMSGYAQESVMREVAADPGAAYVAKPFTAAILARRVRELLDAPSPR